MKNKEVIEKLEQYFIKQDPYLVCRLLAATLVDVNRLMRHEKLDKKQFDCLLCRMQHNMKELHAFLRGESEGQLRLNVVEMPNE